MTAVRTQIGAAPAANEVPRGPTSDLPASTAEAALRYIRDLIPSAGAAPQDAQYYVLAPNAALSAETVVPAFMQTLLDDTDAATARSTLGVYSTADVDTAIAALAAVYQPLDSDLTSWAGVTRASGFDAFAAAPSSANLRSLLTDETGTGAAYFQGGDAGTPSALVLTNATGLTSAGVAGATLVTAADTVASNDNDTTWPTTAAIIDYAQPLDSDLTAIAALSTTTAGRSVLTIADPNADRIIAWDDSAGGMAAIALADITTEASPAAGDFFLMYTAEGALVKVDWDELPAGGAISVSADDLATSVPAFGADALINLAITASVGASALSVAIKGADGNDPGAGNPVLISFRSPTIATGTPVTRSLTSALSLTISSGSTLGTVANVPFRLAVVIFDDAGTLRLGLINTTTGTVDEANVASSTAEGGAGSADTANTYYTGSAVTSKSFRVVGYLEWPAGLGTAGTWSAGPTTIQLFGAGIAPRINTPRIAFLAHKNGTDQTGVADATFTTVTWGTEVFDEGGYFASNTWTPPPGLVFVTATFRLSGTMAAGSQIAVLLRKGTTAILQCDYGSLTNEGVVNVSAFDYADGVNGYNVQAFANVSSGTVTVGGNTTHSRFMGVYLGGPLQ